MINTSFFVRDLYDIGKGDSDFVVDYAIYRKTSVNRDKGNLGWSRFKGREGKKGLCLCCVMDAVLLYTVHLFL